VLPGSKGPVVQRGEALKIEEPALLEEHAEVADCYKVDPMTPGVVTMQQEWNYTESATEIEDYEVEEQYNEADAIVAKTMTEPTFSTNRIALEAYEM
jgi:hypothetical protein